MSTCVICGTDFAARHSYGLCSRCFQKDRARELDRLESAKHKAQKQGLTATLTLRELLATISDFKGLCAFCQEYAYCLIEMIYPSKGLVYDNVVTCCKACHTRRADGYSVAEDSVRRYLITDRAPKEQDAQETQEQESFLQDVQAVQNGLG